MPGQHSFYDLLECVQALNLRYPVAAQPCEIDFFLVYHRQGIPATLIFARFFRWFFRVLSPRSVLSPNPQSFLMAYCAAASCNRSRKEWGRSPSGCEPVYRHGSGQYPLRASGCHRGGMYRSRWKTNIHPLAISYLRSAPPSAFASYSCKEMVFSFQWQRKTGRKGRWSEVAPGDCAGT